MISKTYKSLLLISLSLCSYICSVQAQEANSNYKDPGNKSEILTTTRLDFELKLRKKFYKKGECIIANCHLVNRTPYALEFSSGFDFITDGFHFICKDSLGTIINDNSLRSGLSYLSGCASIAPNGGTYHRSISLDSLSSRLFNGRYILYCIFSPQNGMVPLKSKRAQELKTPDEIFFDQIKEKTITPAVSNSVDFTIH